MLNYHSKLLVSFVISLLMNLNYCILANTYYVSNSYGNDESSGLSSETPFKSLDKINSIAYNPGDSILFKLEIHGTGCPIGLKGLEILIINSY